MSYSSHNIACKIEKLAAVLALALCLISTRASAETSLVVTGPASIEAGDDFTIFYTISWEVGDILPDNPVIGVSSTLMEFPAFIGTEMEIEGNNTTPDRVHLNWSACKVSLGA